MSKIRFDNLTPRALFRNAGFTGKIAFILSTFFGTGLIKFAPGTFGTMASVPLILAMDQFEIPYRVSAILCVAALAVWSAGRSEVLFKRRDPPQVVIDEVAGFSLTMFCVPLNGMTIACGFLLFRFFDILKPFPLRMMERRIKGGLGVVADDLGAGLLANLGVRIALHMMN
jgi:phosphatidylglycerophosphatase A